MRPSNVGREILIGPEAASTELRKLRGGSNGAEVAAPAVLDDPRILGKYGPISGIVVDDLRTVLLSVADAQRPLDAGGQLQRRDIAQAILRHVERARRID